MRLRPDRLLVSVPVMVDQIDVILHSAMTDRALLEQARRMVVSPASFSPAALRAVIAEIRRRRLDVE